MDRITKAMDTLNRRLEAADMPSIDVPDCTFREFLDKHAMVRLNDGSYIRYNFKGRRPLIFIADLVDKILRNTIDGESVEIDGETYAPGSLKGSTISVCGGAQFGKTILALNFAAWLTSVKFRSFGFFSSDRELLAGIVDTKFRPDVVDQIAWLPEMIQLNKGEGKSKKTVNKKNAFRVSDGDHNAFGYFISLQKPTTTYSMDVAELDEVDDIPAKNIGYVAGRLTNSDIQLTWYMGTQRIHGDGQNARWLSGTMHRWITPCPGCGAEVNIEEQWPGVSRIALDGARTLQDPKLDETMQFEPDADYYAACPECGTALDPDGGHYEARKPELARARNWSIRVSQMDVPAIKWRDQVASWFAALADPNPEALAAWHCDRRAIPLAGASQPIVPYVLSRARRAAKAEIIEPDSEPAPYAMTLARQGVTRVIGMDTGPRCWLWSNDIISPRVHALSWAEMVPSGRAFARCVELYTSGLVDCIFIDAGGEPDLTKRICLTLNGLDDYEPPFMPVNELKRAYLGNIGDGVTWDGSQGKWSGIKAASVLFSLRPGAGVQQDIGFTQDGKIYPIIKCNRAEAIQGFVNNFLTPKEGVVTHIEGELRTLPLQRLPETAIGAGVTNSILDTHLQNLRKGKKPGQAQEDWLDSVENHLGFAGVYARLAANSAAISKPRPFHYCAVETRRSRNMQARSVMMS